MKEWAKKASSDPDVIRSLLSDYPGQGLGIVTGARSGVIVVDIDVANGKPGEESMAQLLGEAKLQRKDLETLESKTPSGGRHLYFLYDRSFELRTRHGLLPGIDLLVDDHLAVEYPTVREDGKRYEWRTPIDEWDTIPDLIRPMPREFARVLSGHLQPKADRSRKHGPANRVAAVEEDRYSLSDAELDRVRRALAFIPSDDHDLWALVGLCLAFWVDPEEAWKIFDEWSQKGEGYDPSENLARWENFEDNSVGSVTPDWIYQLARRDFFWPDPLYRDAVPTEVTNTVPLQTAAAALTEELTRAVTDLLGTDGPAHGLFYAPMGSGKTRSAVDVLAEHGPRIIFACRNWALVEELKVLLDGRGVVYVEDVGVSRGCSFKEEFKAQGSPSTWRSVACSDCSLRDDCSVFEVARLREAEEDIPLILTVHAKIPFIMDSFPDRLVIYDEVPETVETVEVSSSILSRSAEHRAVDKDVRPSIRRLRDLLVEAQDRADDVIRGSKSKQEPPSFAHSESLSLICDAAAQFELASVCDSLRFLAPSAAQHSSDDVMQGSERVVDVMRIARFAQALHAAFRDQGGVALQLSLRAKQFEWTAMLRQQAPRRALVLDGTAKFSRRELEAWVGSDPEIYGVEVEPVNGVEVNQVLYLGRRYNRRRLRGDELKTSAEFLANECMSIANAESPGRPLAEVLAVLVPKVLADYLRREKLLPEECVGHFLKDEKGSNQFEGRPIVVTAGDFHESIGVVEQRATCLGIDSAQLIDDRRCVLQLQAGARGRWMRTPGSYVDVHFGAMARPGWSDGTVDRRPQPNKKEEKRILRQELREAAQFLADDGVPVTVDLMLVLLDTVNADLSRETVRKELKELDAMLVRVPNSSAGPGRQSLALVRRGAEDDSRGQIRIARTIAPALGRDFPQLESLLATARTLGIIHRQVLMHPQLLDYCLPGGTIGIDVMNDFDQMPGLGTEEVLALGS